MKKIFFIITFFIIGLIFVFIVLMLVWPVKTASNIKCGLSFSQKQSAALGLDWKENYLAILNELKPKYLRLSTHWDLIEVEPGYYNFSDLDWQIEQARENNVSLILAIGMRTPRWPECHLPNWVKNLSTREQQDKVNELIKQIILRYRDEATIIAWQVENEPFFLFGECPARQKGFLDEEVKLVKSLDNRPIITTDSGEWSFWIKTAKRGDIFGISLYRRVWSTTFSFVHKIFPFIPAGFYFDYPFPPQFYSLRVKMIEKLLNKRVIVAELQAEPWLAQSLTNFSEEFTRTMDFEKFKEMIEFAKKTGLDEFYLWGSEWWYFMKIKQNDLRFWEEAAQLLKE